MRTLSGIEYLMAMPQYGLGGAVAIRPGLDRIRLLLDALDHPERGIPMVHVAGTNGKGSTASWTASILTASGVRTGLHTSPHLLHAGERMRVDGVAASTEWVGAAVDRLREVIEAAGASYFEVTVALSLEYFRVQDVQAAVIEVGLGGRLDATNVITPRVSVITRIARDHTNILGSDLAGIAREKAGIIKPGVPVVTTLQEPEAMRVLEAQAASQEAGLIRVDRDAQWRRGTLRTPRGRYRWLRPSPRGSHYAHNAAAAVLAAEVFQGDALEEKSARCGLSGVRRLAGLRARYEPWRRSPLVVLDVAHNPDALLPLLARFREDSVSTRPEVLLSIMADKELVPIATALRGFRVHALRLESPRALEPAELILRLREAGVDVSDRILEGGDLEAFSRSLDAPLLVTGSHQVVAAFLEAVEG